MRLSLLARMTAEFVGTTFLVAAVVGSGIIGERLAGGNIAVALLANTIATGAACGRSSSRSVPFQERTSILRSLWLIRPSAVFRSVKYRDT